MLVVLAPAGCYVGWQGDAAVGGADDAADAGADATTNSRALCLDAKSGRVVWDKEVFLQRAAEALRRMTEDELNEALVGMGDERVHTLRRVRGGMKGIAA